MLLIHEISRVIINTITNYGVFNTLKVMVSFEDLVSIQIIYLLFVLCYCSHKFVSPKLVIGFNVLFCTWLCVRITLMCMPFIEILYFTKVYGLSLWHSCFGLAFGKVLHLHYVVHFGNHLEIDVPNSIAEEPLCGERRV